MLSLNTREGNGYMKGVFIHDAIVKNIEDVSGKPTYQNNPDSIKDLAINVELDIGKSFTKKLIIKGDFFRNGEKIINWGSAFLVKDFFLKIGCFKGLTEEEINDRIKLLEKRQIPADFISKARNKKIFVLDYVREMSDEGKLRCSTWNIVDTDPEQLRNLFKASVAKGYPTNYKPDVLADATVKKEVLVNDADDFPF